MGTEVWFSKGLSFQCTGCGKCCTGSPGYVFLSQKDIIALATHHKMTTELFCKKYTRLVNGEPALLDRPSSGDCIFLENNRCSVYESRPVQCKTFPWWFENLESPDHWARAAEGCEGIGRSEDAIVPKAEIEQQCTTYLDNLIEQNFSL